MFVMMREEKAKLKLLLATKGYTPKQRLNELTIRKKELEKQKRKNHKNEDQLVSTQRAIHKAIVEELGRLYYLRSHYHC
jgi:hypothetical protein